MVSDQSETPSIHSLNEAALSGPLLISPKNYNLSDGDWHTEPVTNEINQLWKESEIPECILVGIGNSQQPSQEIPASSYLPTEWRTIPCIGTDKILRLRINSGKI